MTFNRCAMRGAPAEAATAMACSETRRRVARIIVVAWLGGCASLPNPDLGGADLPARVELSEVPFFAQEDHQCGPATLAAALTYAGAARTPQELTEQVFTPRLNGSLQAEMLAATRRAGMLAYPLAPEPTAILREIAAGHPVVVLQAFADGSSQRWHYALAVGYDLARGEMMLRSGSERRELVGAGDFLASWTQAGRWAFVAVPPQQLPATASEAAAVAAAVSLERVAPPAAGEAYRTILERWPTDLAARIGLGNVAYAGHRLADAEREFRQAVLEHADSADAWNNLAQVLHELGREEAAADAVRRALALGGPRLADYRATAAEIRAAAAP